MNAKKAKQIRKQLNYNPNIDTTKQGDYDVKDTSEFLGMVPNGFDSFGNQQYTELVVVKCTATIKPEHIRSKYKQAKKEMKYDYY